MKRKRNSRRSGGFVMTGVVMLILIGMMVGGAFLFSVRSSFAAVDQWRARDECLFGLQSALEWKKFQIDQVFQTAYAANRSWISLKSLENLSIQNQTVLWTNTYVKPHVITTAVSVVSGSVARNVLNHTADIELTFTAQATHRGVTRKVQETVHYHYGPVGAGGTVFDFAFFVNSSARFDVITSGVNIDFNGDVFSNKDIEFRQQAASRMNGDLYAGGLINVTMRNDDLGSKNNEYGGQGNRTRPMEIANYGASGEEPIHWEQGYSGTVNYYEGERRREMPFVGSIPEYIEYAEAMNGQVTVGGSTVSAVHGVYPAASTNDCLVLIGTPENPIQLDGIVVVTGDVYIRGYYTGQGSIYAGRNIHVLGDLIALDPATWNKPDSSPEATAASNANKDFLALLAKGNLVVGEYTGRPVRDPLDRIEGYIAQGDVTTAVDPSDAWLGYISGYMSDGTPYFNGDYTQPDGGLRADGTARRFYDPWFDHDTMVALSARSPDHLDAVLYANRMIAGTLRPSAQINGAVIARDFFTRVSTGNTSINWDIRLGSRSRDGIDFAPWLLKMLPRYGSVLRIIKWTELAP